VLDYGLRSNCGMDTKTKKCETCGVEFSIKYRVTKAYWSKRKFCSNKCQTISLRGCRLPSFGIPKRSLSDRFWSKVAKREESECWEWIGATKFGGYGKLGNRKHSGSDIAAHRLSYELNVGQIPDGLCVYHKCDNPGCVNPNHLFLGTLADNNSDRESKGRGSDKHGEKNPRARLTPDVVNTVDELRATGMSQAKIGKIVGFPQTTISKICRGVGWIPRKEKV